MRGEDGVPPPRMAFSDLAVPRPSCLGLGSGVLLLLLLSFKDADADLPFFFFPFIWSHSSSCSSRERLSVGGGVAELMVGTCTSRSAMVPCL